VTPFVTAGAGFLLAVLWFDLMHDVQVRGPARAPVAGAALESVARYYRRVTTDARPMNRLVAVVMLGTLVATAAQIARGDVPDWVAWTSLVLIAGAVLLAMFRTVPHAVSLGRADGDVTARSELARAVWHDHVACAIAVSTVLVLQLAFARG
jgi:hypothetical protein